jgi:hypothetical protein
MHCRDAPYDQKEQEYQHTLFTLYVSPSLLNSTPIILRMECLALFKKSEPY